MTRDPHYEDGPRYIGGAEIPRVADADGDFFRCGETGPTYEKEITWVSNGVTYTDTKTTGTVCDLRRWHEGSHEARLIGGSSVCWAQKKARAFVTGGGGFVSNRARHRHDVDGDAADDRAWSDALAEDRDSIDEMRIGRSLRGG